VFCVLNHTNKHHWRVTRQWAIFLQPASNIYCIWTQEARKSLRCSVHINKKQWGGPLKRSYPAYSSHLRQRLDNREAGMFRRYICASCNTFGMCPLWSVSGTQSTDNNNNIQCYGIVVFNSALSKAKWQAKSTLYYCCRYNNYNAHQHYTVSPAARHAPAVILTEATCTTRTWYFNCFWLQL
jgi:hypothetical protein